MTTKTKTTENLVVGVLQCCATRQFHVRCLHFVQPCIIHESWISIYADDDACAGEHLYNCRLRLSDKQKQICVNSMPDDKIEWGMGVELISMLVVYDKQTSIETTLWHWNYLLNFWSNRKFDLRRKIPLNERFIWREIVAWKDPQTMCHYRRLIRLEKQKHCLENAICMIRFVTIAHGTVSNTRNGTTPPACQTHVRILLRMWVWQSTHKLCRVTAFSFCKIYPIFGIGNASIINFCILFAIHLYANGPTPSTLWHSDIDGDWHSCDYITHWWFSIDFNWFTGGGGRRRRRPRPRHNENKPNSNRNCTICPIEWAFRMQLERHWSGKEDRQIVE